MTRDTMTTYLFLLCVTGALAASSPILRCRKCSNAKDLDDCYTIANCDASTEECYMDEVITEQLTIVYNGGCRAKDVCRAASTSSSGKRQSLISCSKCCNSSDGCNGKLCGIRSSNINQCQYCDVTNGFVNVSDPTQCTALITCAPNEMCFASDSVSNGRLIHTYGCQRSLMCKLLMARALQHYQICVSKTVSPPPGATMDEYCGTANLIGRRSTTQCQVCCGDAMCNQGSCTEIIARLAALEEQGKLDMNTLREKV